MLNKITFNQTLLSFVLVLLLGSCAAKKATSTTNPYNPVAKMELLNKKNRKKITKMHFLVFGDSKGRPAFKDVLKRANKLKPEFCITTADLVNKGGGEQGIIDYGKLDKDGGWFMKKYPMWPTVGNHEEAGGEDGIKNFSNFFGMKKAMYAFEYGNAKFIALPWPKIKNNIEKLTWLENELKTANGKHIFIFKHRPHYDVGSKTYEDVEGEETSVTKLYDKYKVMAVFSGHDHLYYRTKRNTTNYIISAGAGAPIYALKREKDAVKDDVYYGKRLIKDIKNGAKPYKFVNAKGDVTDIDKAMYYVLSVKIDKEKVSIEMIESLTGKIWDKAVINTNNTSNSVAKLFDTNKIIIAAHRGGYEKDYEDKAPENSIANIHNAINRGFELYESDIQRTLDDKFIIMHDPTIDRTSNGTGEVAKMNFDELEKYNLKYSNGQVSDEKTPLLKDFINKGNSNIIFKIDFKPEVKYLGALLNEIKATGLQNQIILRFKYKAATARLIAKYNPKDIPTILFRLRNLKQYNELKSIYSPKMISIWEKKEFSPEHIQIINDASKNNIIIEAHTFYNNKINREEYWEQQLKLPITIFHTNKPILFAKFLENKNLR